MNKDRLSQLFELQVSQRATEAERNELRGLMALQEHEEQLKVLFAELWDKYTAEELVFSAEESAAMLKRVFEVVAGVGQEPPVQPVRGKLLSLWPRWRLGVGIAAAVATIVFGIWLFSPSRHSGAGRNLVLAGSDIAPGKSGATITLANGQVIQLDSTKQGVIVGEELKYDDGEVLKQVQYDDRFSSKAQMLTATTAKGQTYEFTMPDGTHVNLNADSKIIFPAQFSGKERKILLEGEAYFLVVHNEKQPFRVESKEPGGGKQTVEDIGTAFNINAYADEGTVKTTLVEGSAAVYADQVPASRTSAAAKQAPVILKPSQQSSLSGGQLKVKRVNTEDVLAWKDGQFRFNNTPLSEILRQIGRWYNLEIVYEDREAGKRTFTGVIRRDSRLSEILRVFEKGGIQFRIADPRKAGGAKRLIVM